MAATLTPSHFNSTVAESEMSRPYSGRSEATWMTQSGMNPMGKGQVLFTGPSGIRDYKVNVVTDDRMVGIGTMSPEGTSALQYIWRGAPGSAPPRRRSNWVGEVGWFVPPFNDSRNTLSGNQIQLRVFRKAQEEKYTHRFQEPWYPAPNDPTYKEMFPFTQGSKVAQRSPSAQRLSRPHTVASFHNEHLPDLNNTNNASTSRPISAHPSVADNQSDYNSRPASGHSIHGYTASQSSAYRPSSVTSVHTPPGSRPGSGNMDFNAGRASSSVQYERHPSAQSVRSRASAQSTQSRGSQVSLRSRASSTMSHSGRRRMVPAATSISSAYKAPSSDPEY